MKRSNFLLGIGLLLIGGFLLAINLNWIAMQNNSIVAAVFLLAGLLFLAVFFTNGIKEWWWLMPATTLSAVGGAILLSTSSVPGEWIGAMFMLALSLPFLVAYLTDRKNWWGLIPGGILLVIAILIVGTATQISEDYWGAFMLAGLGLVFLVVYLTHREHWWALIPGGTLLMIAMLVAGSATAIAEGYWVALMLAGMSIVFAIVYLARRNNWWAIIPAGALAGIALIMLLVAMQLPAALSVRLLGGSFLLVLGLTFGVLWLLREDHPTRWAKYPAAAVTSIGALIMLIGENAEYVGPLILIAVGGWLLWRGQMRS